MNRTLWTLLICFGVVLACGRSPRGSRAIIRRNSFGQRVQLGMQLGKLMRPLLSQKRQEPEMPEPIVPVISIRPPRAAWAKLSDLSQKRQEPEMPEPRLPVISIEEGQKPPGSQGGWYEPPRSQLCFICNGSGLLPCSSCNGTGQWWYWTYGFRCGYCGGYGFWKCSTCGGTGHIR
jgi:hypothetical protein